MSMNLNHSIYPLAVTFVIYMLITVTQCRNHDIKIKNDRRHSILLSHFGYSPNSLLYLFIKNVDISTSGYHKLGLSLDPSSSNSVAAFVETSSSKCFLDEQKMPSLVFEYDYINREMVIETHGSTLGGLLLYEGADFPADSDSTQLGSFRMTSDVQWVLLRNLVRLFAAFVDETDATQIANETMQSITQPVLFTLIEREALLNVIRMKRFEDVRTSINVISDMKMVLTAVRRVRGDDHPVSGKMKLIWAKLQGAVRFKATFPIKLLIKFPTSNEEGDYDLYLHNCALGDTPSVPVNLTMRLIEKNWNSYLSAGDQPLPLIFFIMCAVFIVLTIIWILTLITSKKIFKIHYMMLACLVLKSLTLFFHGICYYELGRNGVPEHGLAIMYYISHVLKGALLFTTIILLGAGWSLIKPKLSGKEKTIFIIALILQILANVAAIIIDESEESTARYLTWRNIFLLVDLICCVAILFPVIWTIKHLKEAASTEAKQAQNLLKLKLFRHFLILMIFYLFSTRIIVYALVITVTFKLTWTVDLFMEFSTVFFIVVTGYKFRPFRNKRFLSVISDENDDVTEEEQLQHASLEKVHGEVESLVFKGDPMFQCLVHKPNGHVVLSICA